MASEKSSVAEKNAAPEMTTVEALTRLAESLKPQGPLEQAGFSQAAIDRLTKLPTPKKHRGIACKSEETGATFIAHVIESKRHPNGRIVALGSYTHPAGIYKYQRDGGLVPNDFPILKDATGALGDGVDVQKHQLSVMYLQWRWENFWQRDLARYVGKEITSHLCADGVGLKTPWLEGAVRSLNGAEDEG